MMGKSNIGPENMSPLGGMLSVCPSDNWSPQPTLLIDHIEMFAARNHLPLIEWPRIIGWAAILINSLLVAPEGFSQDVPKLPQSPNIRPADEGPGDREDRLLRNMFAHGLHEAALRYVRARQSLELNSDTAVWWSMREMECMAQLALRDRSEAEQHWQSCSEIAKRYSENRVPDGNPSLDSRWPWIVWQQGRCQLLRLQVALANVLANPSNVSQRESAMAMAREIQREMESLQADIRRRQPLVGRQPTSGSEATSEQLRNLEADSQLLVAETLLIRSQLYPVGSADRAAALAEVLVSVRDVLSRTGSDWSLRPAMQLAEATAELELGEDAAIDRLRSLMMDGADRHTRLLAGISGIDGLIKRGDLMMANAWLDSLEPLAVSEPSLLPPWMLARLNIQLSEIKNQPDSARDHLIKTLTSQAKSIGERFGDYWQMRAEALILEQLSGGEVSDAQLAMDILAAEVRQLLAGGQTEAALEKMARARDRQLQSGSRTEALTIVSMAAALLRENNRLDESISLLEPTVIELSSVAGADTAHLWVIRAYAQLLRSHPNSQSAAQSYENALIRHLELWPNFNSSDQVQAWIEDWLIGRNQRRLLVANLRLRLHQVTNTEQADFLLSKLMQHMLLLDRSQLQALNTEWAEAKLQFSVPSLFAAVDRLQLAVQSLMEAEGIADWSESPVIEQRIQNFQEWLLQGESLSFQIRSLVAVAELIDRLRVGKTISNNQWDAFLELPVNARPLAATALVESMDAAEDSRRIQLLQTFQLPSDWMDAERQKELDIGILAMKDSPLQPLAEISLLRLTSDLEDPAIGRAWEQTVKKNVRNGPVQLMVAYHYLHNGQIEKAIEIAKRIITLSSSGSPLQLSARWCLMRGQLRLGSVEDARRMARITLATHVELSPRWNHRFQQIAAP
jgi:hypothetical protein